MSGDYRLRPAESGDQPFLAEMLVEAVNWTPGREVPPEAVRSDPVLSRYVARWPESGEVGVVAEADDTRIGAAWLRFFNSDDPGYGYVADDVPELSVAVVPSWRGRGVGRSLLQQLAREARTTGIRRISLSVEPANFAQALYLSEGYEVVQHDNQADTMVLDLADAQRATPLGRTAGGR